jgi:hypothetical protein
MESHRVLWTLLEIDYPVPQIFHEGDLSPRYFLRSSKKGVSNPRYGILPLKGALFNERVI